MGILQICFYSLMLAWLVTEIYYAISMRSGKQDKKGKDGHSLLILWIIIPLSIWTSISVSSIFNYPIASGDWLYWIGIILLFVGIVTRIIIIKNLGKYFTVDVSIKSDHAIKSDGFYTYVRHPSYAFSMLTFLGLGLALNNWVSLAIAFIPPFIAFSYRIFVEEKALIEQFGKNYEDYRLHTKKLIPFIY
ncbi:Protein-S-isoprenylcysteine O-methyltransferase Ste14 [Soonwooa buanensis]|uniref:Protein-S-isoprenylcysteine O-methyltransferase Ste14 n=2 Tax=Soonwooa buanensis TaxID=619805 RepID=A0A1T5FTS0_9FLAO|nr:Protein-S-isoprenylcysteine O-methyltransferase Ste14 [Soonwooa buanensis]